MLILFVAQAACQKIDPQLLALNEKNEGGGGGGGVVAPGSLPNGRITLGSDEAVLSAGTFKLKGRVSTLEAPVLQAGSYKLKGTVKF